MNKEVEVMKSPDDPPDQGNGSNGPDKELEITISYNGLDKPLTVLLDELISSVLARAIALFGNLPQPHTLALYTEKYGELPDDQTVKEAKIKKRDKVLLRPSTVKAG